MLALMALFNTLITAPLLSIGVLRPLTVELDGTRIVPAAAKPRQILALLSLSPRGIIGVPALRQELWGKRPPRSASTTLHTYIRQLRVCITAALGPGQDPKQVLHTDSTGYTLMAHHMSADMSEFEQLAQAGRAARPCCRDCTWRCCRAPSSRLGRWHRSTGASRRP